MALAQKMSKPPQHVYFGPRDPITGDRLEEPVYTYQKYPCAMYHVIHGVEEVNSDEEMAALGSGWSDKPPGPPHAPSQEQIKAAHGDNSSTLHLPKKS